MAWFNCVIWLGRLPATAAVVALFMAAGAMAQTTLSEYSIDVNGVERTYLLAVPLHTFTDQLTLVLVFHGGGGSPTGIANTTQMHVLGEQNGFMVVYPAGLSNTPTSSASWNSGGDPPQGWAEISRVDDVGFIQALLQKLKSQYPIDPTRIFATGISRGGMFAYHLACRMGGAIAAIAPVAATLNSVGCTLAEPVSLLHIHGTNDQNVPYYGGSGKYSARGADWPPAPQGIDFFRQNNSCAMNTTEIFKNADTTCLRYSSCAENQYVSYCLITNGGHVWPGSTPSARVQQEGIYVTQDFDASSAIWQFFSVRHD